MNRPILLTLLGMTALAVSCAVKAPEVRVTGERTALEQEVLGTYEELEEDTWIVASTRSANDTHKPPVLSEEKNRVLEAYRTQKYNEDDVNEFKRKGWVGENNRGFLEIRPGEEAQEAETRTLVASVVKDQNQAREVIVQRMVELNASLQDASRDEILAIFAKMNQDRSIKGTWIQQPDGTWIKKANASTIGS